MNIEIQNPTVQTRTITGAKGQFELHQLEGWAQISNTGYPEKVLLNVDSKDRFEVGIYELMPETFYVGSFNKLEIGKAVLKKVK